jgi:hypothetical protein
MNIDILLFAQINPKEIKGVAIIRKLGNSCVFHGIMSIQPGKNAWVI